MGWTYQYTAPADPKAAMDSHYTFSNALGSRRVLASVIKNRRVYYAAVETLHGDGSREVWAGVALVDLKRGADGMAFGYKTMSEHMGPCESECPAHILALLTPLAENEEYAIAWRERCRAALSAKKKNALADGARVTMRAPYSLPSGPCNVFTARKVGRSWRFVAATDGRPYRLGSYSSNVAEISAA